MAVGTQFAPAPTFDKEAIQCSRVTVARKIPNTVESTTGDKMAEEIIFSVQESPEGGYEVQALSAPIFTEADTLEELRAAVRDATECHFEEGQRPHLIRLHFVRDEVIAV